MLELCLVMKLMTRRLFKDIHVPSKTASIIEDMSVGSNIPIIEEGHASYEDTSEVIYAIAESGTSLDVDTHAHAISESAPKLADSNVSSQIFRYSFTTPLIEEDIEHETVDSSVVTSSVPSESLMLRKILWLFQSVHLLVSHISSLP